MTTDEKTSDLLVEKFQDLSNAELKSLSWGNEDCAEYYENIPIEELENFARLGGLEGGCDIELAYPYIKNTNTLVDVGAGYGRAIKNLLRIGYEGKIFAIERCSQFCDRLKKQYPQYAEIHNSDFLLSKLPVQVDVVLSLWSGISEFPGNYQYHVLTKLLSFLKPEGTLILETINHEVNPKNVFSQGQSYVAFSKYGTAYGYTPTPEEIASYAKQASAQIVDIINYETPTNRKRILYIIKLKN